MTPQQNGYLVLGIYNHFHSLPGRALAANNFVAVASRRRIPIDELQQGIDYASRMNWIEKNRDGFLLLTEQGFEEMAKTQLSDGNERE